MRTDQLSFFSHPERSESASAVEGPRAVLRASCRDDCASTDYPSATWVDLTNRQIPKSWTYARRTARGPSTRAALAQDDRRRSFSEEPGSPRSKNSQTLRITEEPDSFRLSGG